MIRFRQRGDPRNTRDDAPNRPAKSPASYDPLATPDFFPTNIDPKRNTIQFAQMLKDTFRQSVFLDRRIVRAGPTTLTADISKLTTRRAGPPLQFILHVAFCGSTLLARYIEALPHCLVLKEPGVLGQLASLKWTAPTATDSQPWDEWFRVTMALLSRGYQEDLSILIKAADMCNWMGNLFLDHDERTRIVFLFIPLRTFLLQVLKVDHRRQWLREHMQVLRWPMAHVPFLSQINPDDLRDEQCAAAMWLINAFLCRALLQRPDSHRVLVLNGDDLISEPRTNAVAVADYLGLLADEPNRNAIRELFPLSCHAKDKRLAYDANTRAAELADAAARYDSEVEAAMSWAETVSSGWLAMSPFAVQ